MIAAMKQFIINICYREKGKPSSDIREMQLVAHSIQDAKSAFALWQFETQTKFKYVIVSATKLSEVIDTEEKKAWLRREPNRAKSQIYVCPWCQDTCYAPSGGCNYRFCPRCGKEVIKEQS